MRAGLGCVLGWLLLAVCAPLAVARAQTPLAGVWQAGATTLDVSIDSWGKDCGPEPSSMRSAGGGSVQIEQEGERLIIRARDRVLYSDRCASPNPAVQRISTSHVANTWTTHCRTDAKDPRQEAATYTIEVVSPDLLRYRDQSHFDWRLHDSTCKATITTTQLLERRAIPAGAPGSPLAMAPAAGAAGAGGGAEQAQVSPPPCTPGAPARLSLRPSRVELALGERTCFELRVVDAEGCPIPHPSVHLTLEHGPGIRAQLQGRCFLAAKRSAEGEGTFRVLASMGRLQDQSEVTVSAEQLPSLIAARVQSSAITGMPDALVAGADAPRPVEAAPPTAAAPSTSRVAARAAPETEPSRRKLGLLAIAFLLVLAAVAFVLRRERAQPARAGTAPTAAATSTSASTVTSPATATPKPASASTPVSTSTAGLRCPRCGTRFEAGNTFCGVDGERLVPDP